MATTTIPQMYRSVLRQFVQNSIQVRAKRSPTVTGHLRLIFESGRAFKVGSPEAAKLAKDAEDMVVYLKAHRLHKELVERYNPTNTLSGEERARMSAGMVGLNMPKPFAADEVPTMESARAKTMAEARAKLDAGKGSLQSMFSNE